MKFKRTGWRVERYESFVDIYPLDDLKEHATGDECWCSPQVKTERGHVPVVVHNSADKRELNEPDHWQEKYVGL